MITAFPSCPSSIMPRIQVLMWLPQPFLNCFSAFILLLFYFIIYIYYYIYLFILLLIHISYYNSSTLMKAKSNSGRLKPLPPFMLKHQKSAIRIISLIDKNPSDDRAPCHLQQEVGIFSNIQASLGLFIEAQNDNGLGCKGP